MRSRAIDRQLITTVGLLLFAAAACGDRSASSASKPRATSTISSPPAPVDHLLAGELGASGQLAFGLPVPNGMTIERAFPDAIHLVGEVTVVGLIGYLRKHLDLAAPELVGSVLRFDRVHLPNQDAAREYRLEIAQRGREVRLVLKDVTPTQPTPGLSDEERWRQAGLKPNGMPLSISDLR